VVLALARLLPTISSSCVRARAPERYRHVATLAEKGLASEEIAQVLQVSPDEAQQLVRLAEVARGKS